MSCTCFLNPPCSYCTEKVLIDEYCEERGISCEQMGDDMWLVDGHVVEYVDLQYFVDDELNVDIHKWLDER